jgi:hypothetical protein
MAIILKAGMRRLLWIVGGLLLAFSIAFMVFINVYLEPALQRKLHSLIVDGSDSLYTYKLGELRASFLGGNIQVRDLQIRVDSAHFHRLKQRNALPSLTLQMNLGRGDIKGIGLLPLLIGRKVQVGEIRSADANIQLIRHAPDTSRVKISPPLWKGIQKSIAGISIKQVHLDGIKFLYRPSDTAQSVKLQFDRFDAKINDIRIDSAASVDTTRLGYASRIFFRFRDMKFRTPDSSYKLKAQYVTYSSEDHSLELDSFKLQPTLEKEDFYRYYGVQASLYTIEFKKVRMINFYLDRFINQDIFEADSMLLQVPRISVYSDKTQEKLFDSKIGQYPHQRLLGANARIRLRNVSLQDAFIRYRERNGNTGEEGELKLENVNMQMQNVSNDRTQLGGNSLCTAQATGKILGGSPLQVNFRFYLDSPRGRFDVEGNIKNVTAAQLNTVALPLANTKVLSLHINNLAFKIRGEDMDGWADVSVNYRNLAIELRKTDTITGVTEKRTFINKLLNRYVVYPDNPGPNGMERKAFNARYMRRTTDAFFGVVWKSIFAGMQKVMMKA